MLIAHGWNRNTTSPLTTASSTLRSRIIRTTLYLGVFILIATLLLLLIRLFLVPLVVLCFPSVDPYLYDFGVYGVYPERHYHSFNLTSPTPRTPRWKADVCDAETEGGGLVLLDLHGTGVSRKGPAVLDLKGNLMWTNDSYGQHAMNTNVQEYKGRQYLTFWAGDDRKGNYYMLDSGFNLAYSISAVGQDV